MPIETKRESKIKDKVFEVTMDGRSVKEQRDSVYWWFNRGFQMNNRNFPSISESGKITVGVLQGEEFKSKNFLDWRHEIREYLKNIHGCARFLYPDEALAFFAQHREEFCPPMRMIYHVPMIAFIEGKDCAFQAGGFNPYFWLYLMDPDGYTHSACHLAFVFPW